METLARARMALEKGLTPTDAMFEVLRRNVGRVGHLPLHAVCISAGRLVSKDFTGSDGRSETWTFGYRTDGRLHVERGMSAA